MTIVIIDDNYQSDGCGLVIAFCALCFFIIATGGIFWLGPHGEIMPRVPAAILTAVVSGIVYLISRVISKGETISILKLILISTLISAIVFTIWTLRDIPADAKEIEKWGYYLAAPLVCTGVCLFPTAIYNLLMFVIDKLITPNTESNQTNQKPPE